MTKPIYIIIFTVFLVIFSCKNKIKTESKAENETVKEIIVDWKDHWEKPKEKSELLASPKVHYRIKESLRDTAIIVLTSFFENPDSYSTAKSIGDINNDGVNDSILVIPELYITAEGSYENGSSIIFIDKNIPRIRVDVTCLDTDYIFQVADIDEDGIVELGKYYTSCVSRFKRLELISLKNSEWEILGQVTFDISIEKPKKEERIKKISLNKFQMREIIAESNDMKTDIWKTFEIK